MDVASFLRRRFGWFIVGLIVGVLAAGGYSAAQPATYSSTNRLYVATGSANLLEAYQGAQAAQQSARTYATLSTGRGLLQDAIRRAGVQISVDELAADLTVNLPPQTAVFDVTVTNRDGQDAIRLSRAIGDELIDLAKSLEAPIAGGAPSIRIVTVDPEASSATRDPFLNTSVLIIGAVIGLIAGTVFAGLLEIRRNRKRRRNDADAAHPDVDPPPPAVPLPAEVVPEQAVEPIRAQSYTEPEPPRRSPSPAYETNGNGLTNGNGQTNGHLNGNGEVYAGRHGRRENPYEQDRR